MHLTIKVSEEQHRFLNASASLQGKSVEKFVLEKALENSDFVIEDDDGVKELMEFLKPRIEEARRGEFVEVSMDEIIEEAVRESQGNK